MARPAPKVVHLKRKNGAEVVGCDVYIGRAARQGGWNLPDSKWANPFRLRADQSNREQVLAEYEAYVRRRPELMAELGGLGGKRLGCWCKPLPCHGDVLVRLYEELVAALQGDGAVPGGAVPGGAVPGGAIPDDDAIWREIGL